jgi:hypothetical protein
MKVIFEGNKNTNMTNVAEKIKKRALKIYYLYVKKKNSPVDKTDLPKWRITKY